MADHDANHDEQHYCTGCGNKALIQCDYCGEWRCEPHSGLCLSTGKTWCVRGGGEPVGTHCAKSRVPQGAETRCEHLGPNHAGAVRRVSFISFKGRQPGTVPPGNTFLMCERHLVENARGGWRWREVVDEQPLPATNKQLLSSAVGRWPSTPREIDAALGLPSWGCTDVIIPLSGGEVKHVYRDGSWEIRRADGTVRCSWSPPHRVERAEVYREKPQKTKFVLYFNYCEHAPPRELVESCRTLLDGTEGGNPVEVPLVWSARMKVEWERHEAEIAAGRPRYRPEHEVPPPEGVDLYGGAADVGKIGDRPPFPLRCDVCGGWVRRRSVER